MTEELQHGLEDFKLYRHEDKLQLKVDLRMDATCKKCNEIFTAQISVIDELINNGFGILNILTDRLYDQIVEYSSHGSNRSDDAFYKFKNEVIAVDGTYNPCADVVEKSNDADTLYNGSFDLPGAKYLVACPAEDCFLKETDMSPLRNIVIHLNDSHKWTREAIADWLESIHDPTGENGPNLNFQVKEETDENI
jgi:hypothetical protein